MPPELQTKIGEYEVKEKLGQGGYGAVYKARDPLGRDVAIKLLTGFSDDASTLNAFKKEASTLAKLQHPNIVTVYHFGVDNHRPYLAMEYVQGQPLSAIIKTRRELHLVEKLDIILQATEGLKHAHEHNVIHRDIKPHNLMVVESAEKSLVVKLIDFGIAQGEASRSQSQSIAGSLPYMSPEHFVQRRTPWCDVFSMGVVLYELLTGGTVPYASDRDELPVAYGKLMSSDPAIPIGQYLPDLPPGLEEVVAKVINKRKLSGYETAEEFFYELSRVQDIVKAQFVSEHLAEVDVAVRNQDATKAYDLVARILCIDPKNPDANRKKFELKKLIDESRRNQQVRAICVRVEGAIQERQFEAAVRGLDEARQIDPGSPTVAHLEQKLADIRRVQERISQLVRAAQQHGKSGKWAEASSAIREAAELDRSNTDVLRFQAEIERRSAQEYNLIEQASSLLHEQRFRDASTVIRELEAMAPHSERVLALKELAVREHREYTRRTEIEAYLSEAQRLASEGDLASARARLDEAIGKYADERSLLELRAAVEQQQEEKARRQFVEEKKRSAEQAIRLRDYIDAIALLEQAIRRVPDPGLEDLLAHAKAKAQEQVADKRREQYLKSAKDSLTRKDAASAVVTLEMAQSEFAADLQIQSMLEEARRIAQRQAREAAERERIAAERQAREAAERDEINAAMLNARGAGQQGDFNLGLKLIEQAASKFGMRPELSAAGNEIKAARSAEAGAQIGALIGHANSEAELQHYPEALQAIERARAFAEFASQTATYKLNGAEQQIRGAIAAAEEEARRAEQQTMRVSAAEIPAAPVAPVNDTSATRLFDDTRSNTPPRIDTDATIVLQPSSPSRAATAAARARSRVPETEIEQPTVAPSPQVGKVEPAPPPSSTKWVAIVAAVVVLAIAVGLYFYFTSSGAVEVSFAADPAQTEVAISGQHCAVPCSLKLKPGHYTLSATHDQYDALTKEIDVTKPYTEKLTLSAAHLPPQPPPAASEVVLGTLALEVNVAGADVFVDDQFKETVKGKKASIRIAVGSHNIKIEKNGYQESAKPTEISKDSTANLKFDLVTGGTVKTYVIVTSVPGAKVVVDGKSSTYVQSTRNGSVEVDPGRHSIEVSLDGYQSNSATVVAKEGLKNTVKVDLKPNPKPTAPTVLAFTADPASIQEGQSAQLKWDAKDATKVTIDGVGSFGPSGSASVTPKKDTNYTLIAEGPGGPATAQRLVKVATKVEAAKPPVVSFDLGSDKIQQGEKTKLFWEAQNADNVSIEGIGSVPAKGQREVSPAKTTTYTLTAKGPGGTVSSQPLTLTVVEAKVASIPTQPVTPPPAAGPSDAQLIKELIEQRWKAAFESDSLSELKAIFPNIPEATQKAIAGARGIKLDLNCTPSISGDKATARCSQTVSGKGSNSRGTAVFNLSKASGAWQIQSTK